MKNMLKYISAGILLFSLVFTSFTQTVTPTLTPTPTPTPTPAVEVFPAWSAPVPRDKAVTIWNPKPTTGNNIFKGDGERWLADAILKVEIGRLMPIKDKNVSDYVTHVGDNLLPYSRAVKKPFEFVVLCDHDEDAFSIGGGHIYITLGMLELMDSEDELAGVLAHEIGHDAFFHVPKTVTRQLFWMKGITKINSATDAEMALSQLNEAYQKNTFALFGELLLGWSRNDEAQADKTGFYTIYKAGYNPEAMKTFFQKDIKKQKNELGKDYDYYQFLIFFLGKHPPSSLRATAMDIESIWITKSPKGERYKSAAFDAMKESITKLKCYDSSKIKAQ